MTNAICKTIALAATIDTLLHQTALNEVCSLISLIKITTENSSIPNNCRTFRNPITKLKTSSIKDYIKIKLIIIEKLSQGMIIVVSLFTKKSIYQQKQKNIKCPKLTDYQ